MGAEELRIVAATPPPGSGDGRLSWPYLVLLAALTAVVIYVAIRRLRTSLKSDRSNFGYKVVNGLYVGGEQIAVTGPSSLARDERIIRVAYASGYVYARRFHYSRSLHPTYVFRRLYVVNPHPVHPPQAFSGQPPVSSPFHEGW